MRCQFHPILFNGRWTKLGLRKFECNLWQRFGTVSYSLPSAQTIQALCIFRTITASNPRRVVRLNECTLIYAVILPGVRQINEYSESIL